MFLSSGAVFQLTSRVLWVLLRQYLGHGLRCLRLRGLLLSARRGAFLTESWLQALRSKCPRLRRLCLQYTDLRSLRSCRLLPASLQVLELRSCEVSPGFFSQDPETGGKAAASAVAIETLVLDGVPSFSDQHLCGLSTWQQLSRLELRDLGRVSAGGVRSCVPPGAQTLARLTHLELGTWRYAQMVALGLGKGWPGLETLTLGGNEVSPGLLSVSRLQDLRWLRLRACRLNTKTVLRCCRCVRDTFTSSQCTRERDTIISASVSSPAVSVFKLCIFPAQQDCVYLIKNTLK